MIYAACFVWGPTWRGKKVLLHTDNEAATFLEFAMSLQHISGSDNKLADLLSHLQVDTFHQMSANTDEHPTQLPPDVWDI